MDGSTAVSGVTTFLSAIGSIVSSAVGWMGSYIGALTKSGNEMLLVFVALPLVGLGIGLIKRMISVN